MSKFAKDSIEKVIEGAIAVLTAVASLYAVYKKFKRKDKHDQ